MSALAGGLARPFERLSDRTGADALVGQRLLTVDGESVVVPTDAAFAFLEVQAKGGGNIGNTANASGGGAASDAIIAVQAGQSVTASLPYNTTTAAEIASISYAGSMVASASSPPVSNSPNQAGASGKYPGKSAGSGIGGRGGGRLAGSGTIGNRNSTNLSAGYGCGQSATNLSTQTGMPVACVTFFRTYEAAIAFARSLYGGTWTP